MWRARPQAPYATLIRLARTYYHSEIYYDLRRAFIRRAGRDDPEIRTFRTELARAVADPAALPAGELFAAEYDDGDDPSFLQRLARDLAGPWSF